MDRYQKVLFGKEELIKFIRIKLIFSKDLELLKNLKNMQLMNMVN
jgi:hypothetical protein